MGFRTGSYAKVWDIEPKSDSYTKIRISIDHMDKQTHEYKQDFSGYVSVFGTASASKAAKLNKGDTIKLGDVDVTTTYDAAKKITYTNYKCFSFEIPEPINKGSKQEDPKKEVDSGEPDNVEEPSGLPF